MQLQPAESTRNRIILKVLLPDGTSVSGYGFELLSVDASSSLSKLPTVQQKKLTAENIILK